MADRAIITARGAAAGPAAGDVEPAGVTVTGETGGGTLVEGDRSAIDALERQGFRVKLLRDTNLLRIGDQEIDIDAAPTAAPADADPGDAATLHLVQLVAPPNDEWVRIIEARDVDVVEPVSTYGLVVAARAGRVAALVELTFVAWTGPLRPELRIAPSARNQSGEVPLSITVYPASASADVAALVTARGGSVVRRTELPAAYGGVFALLTVTVAAISAAGSGDRPAPTARSRPSAGSASSSSSPISSTSSSSRRRRGSSRAPSRCAATSSSSSSSASSGSRGPTGRSTTSSTGARTVGRERTSSSRWRSSRCSPCSRARRRVTPERRSRWSSSRSSSS